MPVGPFIENSEQKAETHKGKKVAKPTAGFGHVQLVGTEIDDVAVDP